MIQTAVRAANVGEESLKQIFSTTPNKTHAIKKPTTEAEYETYQKEVCSKCALAFEVDYKRSKQGCMPIDLYGMFESPTQIIKENGKCMCFRSK